VAIAYKNTALIADEVLPLTPVGNREFVYLRHTKEDAFTVPDTRVGRRGTPNQISFSAAELTTQTEDFALEDPIPGDDIESAKASGIPGLMDPVGKSVEYLTNLLELDKEIRVANLIFNAATYPVTNRVLLSGTSQFSDFTNSNPLNAMLGYLDIPLMRPNMMTLGQDVWRVLRQHPRIVEAVKGTGAGVNAQGTIARQQLAELLEIDQVLVGQGWVNTARRGVAATYARVWGKNISFQYRDLLAGAQRGTTFGFNAMWGGRIAGQIDDPDIGMRGGVKNRVGYSCKEVVSAPDLGFFIQAAVA
jgi:hypothetical protein